MTGWREKAACRELDTALFFPIGTTGPALEQIARAKAVCASCPVIRECLEWALDNNEQDGIWGGTDEDKRRRLRRALQRHRTRP
ncbi:MAG: WhiB family transcriptional regulator [Egibacteraceae bacterium]